MPLAAHAQERVLGTWNGCVDKEMQITIRGSVIVVQQPAATNGWTAVIRVHDPQPGYGHYDFDAAWQ